MFKEILLAITPSELCDCAADKAFSFAQRFDSKLVILHVCGGVQGWGDANYLQMDKEVDRVKESIQNYYSGKLKGLKNYEIKVVPGVPTTEILREARKMDSDLIVMGPHTRGFWERRAKMWEVAGSTLEQVSQKARCPVMIVTKSSPYGEQKFKHVLAATDFSDQAYCAVLYGSQLARHYNAAITVFHCVEIVDEIGRVMIPQDQVQGQIDAAKARIDEAYGNRLRGIKNCHFEATEGVPAMEIMRLARLREADLVIMAHHTQEKDPEKAFLGSTVIQVALNSTAPTMSVNRHFDLRCGLMYDQTGAVTQDPAAPKSKVAEV